MSPTSALDGWEPASPKNVIATTVKSAPRIRLICLPSVKVHRRRKVGCQTEPDPLDVAHLGDNPFPQATELLGRVKARFRYGYRIQRALLGCARQRFPSQGPPFGPRYHPCIRHRAQVGSDF